MTSLQVMSLRDLPEDGNIQQVKEWLGSFGQIFGYENVVNKQTARNARAFRSYEEADLKAIFSREGSLIYKYLHLKGMQKFA